MEIKKSQLRKIIKEQVSAFFVTPEPLGTVSRSKSLDSALRGHGFKSKDSEVNEKELDRAIQLTMQDLEAGAASRMRSKPMDEAVKGYDHPGKIKVGTLVHIGHAQKGGAGVEGKVTKIDGRTVHIKNKQGKTYKGALKNTAYLNEISGVDSLKPNDPHTPIDEAIRMSNEPRHMPARGYKGRAKKNHQEWVRKLHGLLPKNKIKSLDQLKVNQLYDYGSSPEDAVKALLKKEISGVDSLKPNDPKTPGAEEVEKIAAKDVMEADPKKKGGRPRGGPHIENVRFWDLPEESLRYIIKDASEAVKVNPTARKANKWADEINDAVTVLYWRKKKGIKEEYIQLVVTEGFKVGTKISKVLAQSSTIKMANPKDPRWIFAIVSRFGSKGVTSAPAQDKVSMVVVDKAGKVIKDWGSHLNAKAALKFAQSKGYTKKIDESYAVTEAEKEGKRITALRNILKGHTAGKIDGQIVDAFTAGGLVKLYDQLDKKNHPKFERLPLPKLVEFMWKQVKR